LIIVFLRSSSSFVFLPVLSEIREIRGFNLVLIPVRLRSGQAVVRSSLVAAKGCAGFISEIGGSSFLFISTFCFLLSTFAVLLRPALGTLLLLIGQPVLEVLG